MPTGKVTAKDIRVAPISAPDAREMVRRYHYSRKWVQNSQLHLGVFLDKRCLGVMSFGPSLDKRKIMTIVAGTPWNGFAELNRLAFADELPRNSESRALSVAFRILRAKAPHIQWIVSFADAAQCGDGTIYRAAGFVLTGIKKNTSLWRGPAGDVIADVTVKSNPLGTPGRTRVISRTTMTTGLKGAADGSASMKDWRARGYAPIPGFQLRYLYFLDPTARERLTVPILPFSRIAALGAGMYRGTARAGSIVIDAPDDQSGEGGLIPTPALHAVACDTPVRGGP